VVVVMMMMVMMMMMMMMMTMFRFSDSGTLGLAHLCVWKYKVHPLKDETPLHPEKAKEKEKEKAFQNLAVRRVQM
jgi:hypothetical protein